MTAICFGTSITTDELTGRVLAAYFHIRKGHAHETREFGNGAVLADYNNRGELIGLEIIAPCRVTIVDQLAANEPADIIKKTKKLLRENCPRPLIAA